MTRIFRELHEDKNGAAFIEYTALLGVILAVGLVVLTAVGGWAGRTWDLVCTGLATTPGACTTA